VIESEKVRLTFPTKSCVRVSRPVDVGAPGLEAVAILITASMSIFEGVGGPEVEFEGIECAEGCIKVGLICKMAILVDYHFGQKETELGCLRGTRGRWEMGWMHCSWYL
jgi:hypothetical protein